MMSVVEQKYRRAFEALRGEISGGETGTRLAALDAFLGHGFPPRSQEDWKYTDLSALAQRSFELPAPARGSDAIALPGARAVHFVNGRESAGGDTPVGTAPLRSREWSEPIDALNAAFGLRGLRLSLAAGEAQAPIHVVTEMAGGTGVMAHLRHRIELARGARATVFFEHRGDGDYFTTQVIEITLAEGSQLELVRFQAESAHATHLSRLHAEVGRDASLRFWQADAGAALARHDVNVDLVGAGANASVDGVYAAFGREHHDTHSRIVHVAPHGTSRERFRGVVGDHARAVFNGLIRVAPGARRTDSEQHVANLLLSKRAEVNAKPELQIFNDDVRCIHGATTGALDPAAEFYLRSRGLDLVAARTLLTLAFAREPIAAIPWDAVRERIERHIEQRVRAAVATGLPT